jgi:putative ABC transport system ATP-binding protein
MPEPLIKLENVTKTYNLGNIDISVLKNLSLEINPGSFVSIMGPSGSGKSTLMYLLGCLDTPTTGKIFLDGKDVSNLSENELARVRGKKIGFVFQQFNLLNNLSALENVMLPMVFQGLAESKRIERAKEMLDSLSMTERMNHRPGELSGGEQQRIAIARAFANNPEIIIADEPTGNLDSKTGKMIMDILGDFHKKENKTIVVVTHDPNVAAYSHELIKIKDGQIESIEKQNNQI